MDAPYVAQPISDDLRSLLEASPSAIVAVDEAGRIAYANPSVAATFGYAPDELIGAPVERLVPERLAERHVHHRTSFRGQPSARPMGIGLQLAGRRRDGSEVPVEISLAPLETAGGPLVFATIVDVTARNLLEAQLLHAQKMESIGRLAGGIAHDFNNMLFAIRSHVDILAEDVMATPQPSPHEMLGTLEAIGRATEQATNLTRQLLAFSRRQTVQPAVVDLRAAVDAIQPLLRPLIGEEVRLAVSLDQGTGKVRLDPTQLDQIIVNLVVNARDAMPAGGTVSIETGNVTFDEPYALEHVDVSPGQYVVLAVSDTGHGMDHETRQHVFEPFFTTKAVGKGTGLGLATVYGIVRQAGGHIWLYSEPGLGTTFKLYFPRVEVGERADSGGRVPAQGANRGRVLLVEDEPQVRDAARLVLERAGYTVRTVGDSREALGVIQSRSVPLDVLVTDMVMPGLSGRELAARAMTARPDLGIVLLSGYTSETADVADLVARGARFASKPLAPRDLVALVASVMAEAATAESTPSQ